MPADIEEYDLVIIGTGSGNTIITPEFDSWKIAIIEKGVFGGTCLNRGCIPSKMLVHIANTIHEIETSETLGIDASVTNIRWSDIQERIFNRIDPISDSGESYRNGLSNVTLYKGHARFLDNKKLDVGGKQLVAKNIVIATGAKPVLPEIPGLPETPFHTSDSIMRIDALPESLVVIGGGYIATEMAHIFSSLGCKVTIIARSNQLLRAQDGEISQKFTEAFTNNVDVHLGTHVELVAENDDGKINLTCKTSTEKISISSDMLLIATGSAPASDDLNLGDTDISVKNGYIVTDAQMRTNVPGVFALGDVTNPNQLKHAANAEARIVSHNLINSSTPMTVDLDPLPYAIFTNPQIAAVGMTEEELQRLGTEYVKGCASYSHVAYGWAMENTDGFCKVLADPKNGNILGAHIMGPHASTLIHQLVQGMKFDQNIEDLARGMLYVHPALNEVVENALLAACDACR